ncbi:MAG: hypothetical protein FWE50_03050, partial [Alphaproteobacteria bacterium]|nr:hypothetical protein [Alphaproteobacteria bacterium]
LVADGASAPVSSHKISGLNGVNVTGNAGNITLSGTMYDLWVTNGQGPPSQASWTSNSDTYLSLIQNGNFKDRRRIYGVNGINVSSSGGDIAVSLNNAVGELRDCSTSLAQSNWYTGNYNGSHHLNQSSISGDEFSYCMCDTTTNHVDFSVRVWSAASGGTIIANQGGPSNPNQGSTNPNFCLPTNNPMDVFSMHWGCILANNLPFYPISDQKGEAGRTLPGKIICSIVASGLQKGMFNYLETDPGDPYNGRQETVDCNDLNKISNDPQMLNLCKNVVPGVAIWGNEAMHDDDTANASSISIYFGNELWGLPGEGTFWMKCSGYINECPGK